MKPAEYIYHNKEKYIHNTIMVKRENLDKSYFYAYIRSRPKFKPSLDPYIMENVVVTENRHIYVRETWSKDTQNYTPTRQKLQDLYYELVDLFSTRSLFIKAILDIDPFISHKNMDKKVKRDYQMYYEYFNNFKFIIYDRNLELIKKMEYIKSHLDEFKDYMNW